MSAFIDRYSQFGEHPSLDISCYALADLQRSEHNVWHAVQAIRSLKKYVTEHGGYNCPLFGLLARCVSTGYVFCYVNPGPDTHNRVWYAKFLLRSAAIPTLANANPVFPTLKPFWTTSLSNLTHEGNVDNCWSSTKVEFKPRSLRTEYRVWVEFIVSRDQCIPGEVSCFTSKQSLENGVRQYVVVTTRWCPVSRHARGGTRTCYSRNASRKKKCSVVSKRMFMKLEI